MALGAAAVLFTGGDDEVGGGNPIPQRDGAATSSAGPATYRALDNVCDHIDGGLFASIAPRQPVDPGGPDTASCNLVLDNVDDAVEFDAVLNTVMIHVETQVLEDPAVVEANYNLQVDYQVNATAQILTGDLTEETGEVPGLGERSSAYFAVTTGASGPTGTFDGRYDLIVQDHELVLLVRVDVSRDPEGGPWSRDEFVPQAHQIATTLMDAMRT